MTGAPATALVALGSAVTATDVAAEPPPPHAVNAMASAVATTGECERLENLRPEFMLTSRRGGQRPRRDGRRPAVPFHLPADRRALGALKRHDEAARGWQTLIGHDMARRRALRSNGDWLLRLQREGGAASASLRAPALPAQERRQRRVADWKRRYALTRAEGEVLDLLVQGLPPRAIAEMRGSGVGTVRSQLMTLYDKTGLRSQRVLIAAFGAADGETR